VPNVAVDMHKFMQEARLSGLNPEEIASELKARFNFTLPTDISKTIETMAQAPQAFEGGEGQPEVPPGMRPKTVLEEVIEPIPGAVGLATGAFERGMDIMGRPIAEAVTGIKFPGPLPAEKGAAREMGAIRKDIDKEFTERRGEHVTEIIRRDLRDNIQGILHLFNVVRDAEYYVPQEKSTVEHLWSRGEEGKKTGRQFFTGLSADITKMGDDPFDYVRSRPITAAMILAPHISHVNNLAKAGYGPAVGWVTSESGKAINKAVDSVARQLRKTEPGAKVARTVQQTKFKLQEGRDKARRIIGDPLKQSSQRATELVGLLIEVSNNTGVAVNQIVARWAKTVKEGIEDITPSSSEFSPLPTPLRKPVTFRVEKLREAGISEAKILELWDETQGVKTLTNEYDYHPTTANIGPTKEIIAEIAMNPAEESLILAQQAKPTHITISRTHWKEAVTRFVKQLDQIIDIDPIQVMKTLNHKLSIRATGILVSPTLRNTILKNIEAKVAESGALTPDQFIRFRHAMSTFIEQMNKRDPASTSYQRNAVINIGGKEPIINAQGWEVGTSKPKLIISLADEIITAIDQNPKIARNIYPELLTEAGIEIGAQAKLNTVKRAIEKHIGTSKTSAQWIDNTLRELPDTKEVSPMIAHNPNQIATIMIQEAERYSLRYDIPIKTIKEIAHKITSYKRVPVELVDAFGLTAPLQEIKAPKGRTAEIFAKEVFAPEGVIDSLTYEYNSVQALSDAAGWWQKLNRMMKTNMTANNVAAAVNNITANFGYQMFRRADPSLFKNLVQMMAKYKGYITGEHLRAGKLRLIHLSPEELSFFEAMERSGYLDTTALDIEMGGVGKDPGILGVLGKPGKWLSQKQQKFYKGGDNIFKLEDAWYNTKKLREDLADLEVGNWIELEIRPGQKGRISKAADGFELQVGTEKVFKKVTLEDPKTIWHKKKLSKTELDDIVVRAAARPGQNIFFDYTNVPNIIKWVRASRALGVTSPFFTWMWKATDFPGKPGLISHLMNDGVIYNTNSPLLNQRIAGRNTLTSAKKATVLAGMREAVTDPLNDEILNKVLGYSPKDFNLRLLQLTSNPMYIGHDSMESANQFAPSDVIIRFGQTLMADSVPTGLGPEGQKQFKDWMAAVYPTEEGKYGEMIDFDLSTIEDPELKRDIIIRRKLFKKHHSGEALTAKDIVALIGVSGNPIMETVQLITQADRQGQSLDKRKLFQLAAMALIGGTVARTIDIALGAHPEGRAWSTRKWAENPIDGEQEEFIKWSIRRLTGVGFRPLDVGRRSKRYFKNKSMEWKASLTGELREVLEDPGLSIEDRRNVERRIVELEKIVDGEMVLEQIHFDEVYKVIGELVRKSK
jgi:hypothetical protein